MKKRIFSCPACAAPVEFKLSSSLVAVCEFCQTVVARSDKKVEDHGKVADLALTNSPLHRGQTGKFRDKKFELTGRVQYKHPAGGVWDEWYLAFSQRTVGWLAEAQGKFYLTTEKELDRNVQLPEFGRLSVGDELKLADGKVWTVTETGTATTGAAEGEIPWDFMPGLPHRFADLHGEGDGFATLDYSHDPPIFFEGREIKLADLNLTGENLLADMPATPQSGALQLNCPKCGGPLTLHAPNETNRVCCPNCKSLLDCNEGKLNYLTTLNFAPESLRIPLGTEGTLRGDKYTVIGVMGRYAKWQNQTFPWTEYLLYNPKVGFRWLVDNKFHWSFVEPIPPTAAKERGGTVSYDGQTFMVYDRGHAFVRWVLGEFYWKVTRGERVQTADYIAPPRMISVEFGGSDESSEINASLGTYVPVEEIEEAFGIKEMKRPWTVGTIQPPVEIGKAFLMGLGFCLGLMVLNVIFSAIQPKADQSFFWFGLIALALGPAGRMLYRHNIEVQRWRDSDFSPYVTDEE